MVISNLLVIDGTDITNLVAENGINWSRNDLDGPNAGRTLSGLMIRDRVAVKIKLEVKCRDLSDAEIRTLLNVLYPVYLSVTYEDPIYGVVTKEMYSNNNKATLGYIDTAGKKKWKSVSFPLIER